MKTQHKIVYDLLSELTYIERFTDEQKNIPSVNKMLETFLFKLINILELSDESLFSLKKDISSMYEQRRWNSLTDEEKKTERLKDFS